VFFMTRSWLTLFFKAMCRGVQRRVRAACGVAVPVRRLELEPLESRLAPSVTASFAPRTGLLAVTSNAADPIAITVVGGQVKIDSADPNTGSLSATLVRQITITGGSGNNLIDLSQLTAGVLPNLQSGSIQGNGGLDTLIAPNQPNTWYLTALNQGNLNGTPHFNATTHRFVSATGGFTFQNVENLVGGNALDTFNYTSASAGVTGYLATQGGNLTINSPSVLGTGSSLTLTSSVYTQGGNLSIYADTIYLNTLAGPVTLSTRHLAALPGNPAADVSVGSSGNITLTGTSIVLGSSSKSKGNAQLFSQATNGFGAGSINLTVAQSGGAGLGSGFTFPSLPNLNTSNASITLNATTVMGGAVTFSATAYNLHVTTTPPKSSTQTAIQTGIDFLQSFGVVGAVAASTSSATINLGSASAITATSFAATATATSDAETTSLLIKLGVAIATDNTTASVNAAGQITTTGDTVLQSNAVNTLEALASGGGNIKGAGAAVAIGIENSNSTAVVANTAQINAGGNLTVQANTVNNKAIQATTTTGDDGNAGVGAAIAYIKDTSTAQVNGTARAGSNATIQATEVKNGAPATGMYFLTPTFGGVAATTGVGQDDSGDVITVMQGTSTTSLLGKLQSLVNEQLTNQQKSGQQTQGQAPVYKAAGSLAVDMESNTATASIGPTGVVRAVGSLVVDANMHDRPSVIASANVAPPRIGGVGKPTTTEFAGSVAAVFGFYTNIATATISSGATADAGANLSVTSEAINDAQLADGNLFPSGTLQPTAWTDQSGAGNVTVNPGDIVEVDDNHIGGGTVGDWYQFVGSAAASHLDLTTTNFGNSGLWADLGPSWEFKAQSFIQGFSGFLDNRFGTGSSAADTWSQAIAVNPSAKLGNAGSFTYLALNETSTASIGQGAQINQSTDPAFRTGSQNVNVLATGTNSSLNLGGSVQTPGVSGTREYDFGPTRPGVGMQGSQAVVGAAFVVIQYTDNVTATLSAGVRLYADSLNVDAETTVDNVSSLVSGADSGNFGFNGTVSVVNVNDTTIAQIASGSNVTVGTGDVNNNPATATAVQAHDNLQLFNLSGGLMSASNAGIGASLSLNTVKRDTEAFIGDASGTKSSGPQATLTSGGSVFIDAKSSGTVATLSLAAAKVTGNTAQSNTSQAQQGPRQGGQYGIGVSGDTSINQVADTTLAYIHDAQVTVPAGATLTAPALTINATENTTVAAASGSGAEVTYAQAASSGLAGSYAQNTVTGSTSACVDNSILALAGDMAIEGATTGQLYAVSSSGSLGRNQGTSIAGQVSVNSMGITTKGAVVDQSAVTAGHVAILGESTEGTFAIAGALAYGDLGGFGSAVSLNTVSAPVWGLLQDSDLNASATLDVAAQSDATIKAVTASVGAGTTGEAGAESVSINTITPDTEAVIRRKRSQPSGSLQDVRAANKITVHADDAPTIQAIAGGQGVTGGALGIGQAFALNDIGVNFAGVGGSVSAGTILAEVQATTVTAYETGDVEIHAGSEPNIQVLASALGSAVPSSVQGQQTGNTHLGSGAGSAIDDIVENITATIDNATVTTTQGSVDVIADSTADIAARAEGGGGALADSLGTGLAVIGAGAGAGNVIQDSLTASIQNGSNVATTAGNISVSAEDASTISADAGGFNLVGMQGEQAGTAWSVGASVAANTIADSVLAFINGATATADGTLSVGASADSTIDAQTLAGTTAGSANSNGASSFAGAGAGSLNTIQNTVEAFVGSAATSTHVSTTSGNAIDITASDESTIRANAGGLAAALASGAGSSSGFSTAAAAAYDVVKNTIEAFINNAAVTAGSNLEVTATGSENVDTLSIGIGGTLGNGQQQGLTLTGAGSFSLNNVSNTIAAAIQNSTGANGSPNVVTMHDSVDVEAGDTSDMTAAAGAVQLGVLAGEAGGPGLALGPSVAINQVANAITATIAGASVAGDSGVSVRANGKETLDALSVAGSAAGGNSETSALAFPGAGAAADNVIQNTIEAGIAGNSTVTSAAGAVTVAAEDDSGIIAASGPAALALAGQSSSPVGVFGASLALNTVRNTIEGLIDNSTVTAAGGIQGVGIGVGAIGDETIDATTVASTGGLAGGASGGVSPTGAGAGSTNTVTDTVAALVTGNSQLTTTGTGNGVQLFANDESSIHAVARGTTVYGTSGTTGIAGGSGAAAAQNVITDSVTASIQGSTVTAAGDVDVTAHSIASIVAFTVGLSGALIGGQDAGVLLSGAGSASGNQVSNNVEASIKSAKKGNTTTRSVVTASGAVNVTATDDSTITADAGAGVLGTNLGEGAAGLGLGVSLAINAVGTTVAPGTVRAFIDNSSVTADGNVSVTAEASGETVDAFAVAGSPAGASGEQGGLAFPGAGSASENQVHVTTYAGVTGSSSVRSTGGAVTLDAEDKSTIQAASGCAAVALAGGPTGNVGAAFGASSALNVVGNTTEALIDSSTVTAAGGITGVGVGVCALSTADIVANTVAAAGGVAGGSSGGLMGTGAGAGSTNIITNAVEAIISGGSTVSATGSGDGVSMFANDDSDIHAVAVGAAITGTAGTSGVSGGNGPAVATNAIGNSVVATITGSTVTATGDVDVVAQSGATIDAGTVGLAGALAGGSSAGVALTGAGSASANQIYNTVEASIKAHSTVTSTAGAVNVTGTDTAQITARAGTGALESGLGVGLGTGVSIASNTIGSATTPSSIAAFIDSSTVTGTEGVNITAQATSETIDALTVAGSMGSSSAAATPGAGAGTTNAIYQAITARLTASQASSSAGAVLINATDNALINAAVGTTALSLAGNGGASISGTFGAASAVNTIADTTLANIDSSTVTAAGGVQGLGLGVTAMSTSTIVASTTAAPGSVSGGTGGGLAGSGAGAGSLNTVGNSVRALITGGSNVASTGNGDAVKLSAIDDASITANSVGTPIATGAAGAGAASATNAITDATIASVQGSTVHSAGDVDIFATSLGTTSAFTLGQFGSLSGGNAGAGSASANSVTDSVEASIKAGSVVTSAGTVDLQANNNASMTANAGAGVLGVGEGALGIGTGVAIATNVIGSSTTLNTVTAMIQNSTVTATGGVIVNGQSTATISATTVPGGTAANGSEATTSYGAGDASINTAYATTQALISAGSTVTSGSGDVQVTATDNSSITANAGGVGVTGSGSAVSVGLGQAVARNTVYDTTTAAVDGSTVTSGGRVTVVADSTAGIVAEALGVGVATGNNGPAISGAGSGSTAVNATWNTTQAYIENGSTVTASATGPDAVTVAAQDSATIMAAGGAASAPLGLTPPNGVGIAVGPVVCQNTTNNTVAAFIGASGTLGDATVITSAGGVEVTATSTSQITADAIPVPGSLGSSNTQAGTGAAAINTTFNSVSALVRNGATLRVNGASSDRLVVAAVDQPSIVANVGSAGLAQAAVGSSVGAATTMNTVGDRVTASIDHATVTGANVDAAITATSSDTVLASSIATAGSAVSAPAGAFATSTDNTATLADLGTGTSINVGGTLTVNATSTPSVSGEAQGGSSSIAAAGPVESTADLEGSVRAYIGEGVSVSALAVNVTALGANASGSSAVFANSQLVSIGSAGVGDMKATATMNQTVEAFLGPASTATPTNQATTITATGGSVQVVANSTMTAASTLSGGTAGGATVGATSGIANLDGATNAYVGGHVTINAQQATIRANSTNSAIATTVATSIAAIGGSGIGVTVDANHDTNATIAGGASVTVTGDLNVAAQSAENATANVIGGSGGTVTVSAINASATIEGQSWADVGEGATVSAATVKVTANGINSANAAPSIANLGGYTGGVNVTAAMTPDIEAFIGPSATGSGALTTITASSLAVSAQSTDNALATASNSGAAVDVGTLNLATNVAGSTGAYVAGKDRINSLSLSVTAQGASAANTVASLAAIGAATSDGATAIATDAHNVSAYIAGETALTVNGIVTVEADSTANAIASSTGTSGGAISAGALVTQATESGNTLAYVGAGATINAGSLALTANANGSNATATAGITGLDVLGGSGATTTADVAGTDAAYVGDARGGSSSGNATTINLAGALALVANSSSTPSATVSLGSDGTANGQSLGATATSESSTLAYLGDGARQNKGVNVKAGSVRVIATASDIASSTASVAGGSVNVQGENTQADVTSTVDAHIGRFAVVQTTSTVDVEATSSRAEGHASAANAGSGQVGVASASVDSTPTVNAFIDAGATVSAGGDVSVLASARSDQVQSFSGASGDVGSGHSSASAQGGSGTVGSVSQPTATVTVAAAVQAYVDAKSVSSGGNVRIAAESIGGSDASANNALGSVNGGTATETTNYGSTSRAFVGTYGPSGIDATGVAISAAGEFSLTADSQLTTTLTGSSTDGGSVTSAENDATVNANAVTTSSVGANAQISANCVGLLAIGSSFNITENPDAKSSSQNGSATAKATSSISSTVTMSIGANAMIDGAQGVDIRALNENLALNQNASANASGSAISANHNLYALATNVDAAAGATVIAGPRPGDSPLTPVGSVAGAPYLALYVQAQDSGISNANLDNHSSEGRTIDWNANVTINTGVDPTLVINSAGQVVSADNIAVTDGPGGASVSLGGTITSGTAVVQPIASANIGQAVFDGGDSVTNEPNDPPYPDVHPYPLFTFNYAFQQVTVINQSSANLDLGGINVVDSAALMSGSGMANVQIYSPNVDVNNIPFYFRIADTVNPTTIDIENQGGSQMPSTLVLGGDIVNPIGTTIINNAGGDVLESGGTVWTNVLNLAASGNIGAPGSSVVADLIESADTSGNTRSIGLTAAASAGSVNLDLTGRRRDTNTGPLVVPVTGITAGQNVNVLMEPSLSDPAISGTTSAIEVAVDSSYSFYHSFFHPDDAPSSDSLDPGVFVNINQATPIDATFDFQANPGAIDVNGNPTGGAGLSAGGNIVLTGTLSGGSANTINVVGSVDLTGAGDYIDVGANGNINLVGPADGTLRIGIVQSYSGDVTLTGDQALELVNPAGNTGLVGAAGTVTLQAGESVTTDAGTQVAAGTGITINGEYDNAGGASSIILDGTLTSPQTFINGGSGADTIQLNNPAGLNPGAGGSLVTVDGKGGNDQLVVNDAANMGADTGILSADTILGLGMGGQGLAYTNVENLEVDLAQGGDTFDIVGTRSGTSTLVKGGTGNDSINVGSDTPTNLTTTPPTVPPFQGSLLTAVQGPLTIDAGAGNANTLTISNYASHTAQAVTVTASAITGLAPVPISYTATGGRFLDNTGLNGITLVGANAGGNTFNVQGTLAGSTTAIFGGGAADTFIVSSTAGGPAPATTGNALGIKGSLNVVGGNGAGNRLIVSDFTDPNADANVIVTSDGIIGLAPAAIYYGVLAQSAGLFTDGATKDGILLVGAQGGGNTFNVQSTLAGSTTTISGQGGAADYFNVFSDAAGSGPGVSTASSHVLGIQGDLTVLGGSSANNRLIVSDKADAGGSPTNLGLSQIVVTDHSILNLAPAFIYYGIVPSGAGTHGNFTDASGAADGIAIQGSLSASNTFLVWSTASGSTTELDGGAAVDSFNFAAELAADVGNPDVADSALPATFFHDQGDLNNLRGAVNVVGNGGSDSLEADDHGGLYTIHGVQQYATDANGNPLPLVPLHINDDGLPATGTPSASLSSDPHYQYTANDPATGYNYIVTPGSVANDPGGMARSFAGISYNGAGNASQDTVALVRLDGTDRTNRFTVTPDTRNVTTYFINGNMPTAGGRKDGGDSLNLHTSQMGAPGSAAVFSRTLHVFNQPGTFAATTDGVNYYPDLPAAAAGDTNGQTVPPPTMGQTLQPYNPTTAGVDTGLLAASTGDGFWAFTRGGTTYATPVYFLSIEQFNHVAIVAQVSAQANQPPMVTVKDAETGDVKFTVQPYDPSYHGGINVSVGDVNGDGIPDLVTVPQSGHTAQVNIYNGSPDAFGNYPHPLLNGFTAFGTSQLGGSSAIGDVNGDGINDLVLGSGPGGAPLIDVFDGRTLLNTSPTLLGQPMSAFNNAYHESINQTFTGGVNVAVGDLNGDGHADILATTASNGPPLVNIFSGNGYALLKGFTAFSNSTIPSGLTLAIGDVTGDGVPDIIIAAAPVSIPVVAVFNGPTTLTAVNPKAAQTLTPAASGFRGTIVVQTAPSDGSAGPLVLDTIFATLIPTQNTGATILEPITSVNTASGSAKKG
jgi:hypothetical protein